MRQRFWLILVVCVLSVGQLAAQSRDVVFVQIEAKRSLAEATEAARGYAADLPDVNGFAIGRGWYGIALGPYERSDAQEVLRVYRREGVIPNDSYIALPSSYQRQFWPIGANILGRGALPPPLETETAEPAPAEETTAEAVEEVIEDETPRQAQASERQLTAEERRALQVALQWAGVYPGAIDGAFGRGTRNAMAAWQLQNGMPQTGILTTRQRAELIAQYNAVLNGLGLQVVDNAAAGIRIKLPLDVVAEAGTASPFVRYEASGIVPEARVILISQPGDQARFFGLYDILQTLDSVPLEGARERGQRSFSITGQNDSIVSQTEISHA